MNKKKFAIVQITAMLLVLALFLSSGSLIMPTFTPPAVVRSRFILKLPAQVRKKP